MFLLHFSRFKTFLFLGHSKIKVRNCVLCVYAGTPLTMRVLPVPFFFQKEILVDIASLGGSEVASAFVSIFEIFSKHVRQEISCNDHSALAKPR